MLIRSQAPGVGAGILIVITERGFIRCAAKPLQFVAVRRWMTFIEALSKVFYRTGDLRNLVRGA